MTQSETSLAKIEEWRRKSCESFNQSTDFVLPVMSRALESMVLIHSEKYDSKHIRHALLRFDSERKLSIQLEDDNADSFRNMTHGFIESVYLTFRLLTDKIDSQQEQIDRYLPKLMVEQYIQTDEIPFDFDVNEMKVKIEELMDENPEHPVHIEDVQEIVEFPRPVTNSIDALSTVPAFFKLLPMESKKELVEPKKEPVDTTETMPQDSQISDLDNVGHEMDFMEDGMLNGYVDDRMEDGIAENVNNSLNEPLANNDMNEEPHRIVIRNGGDDAISDDLIEKEGEKEESTHAASDTLKDSSENFEVETRRRSSRIVTKSKTYNDSLDEFDVDSEPSMKKWRYSSKKKKTDNSSSSCKQKDQSDAASEDRIVHKLNGSELECPECEYRSRNVETWATHLRVKHSTNVALACLALLCECGHESFSEQHIRTCTIANFTVIRKRDGPIRRLDDEKTTPQCVLCETYPKTPCGYVFHLHRHHKTTLNENGIYLACDCGLEVHTVHDRTHAKECDRRQFTLHKLNEK